MNLGKELLHHYFLVLLGLRFLSNAFIMELFELAIGLLTFIVAFSSSLGLMSLGLLFGLQLDLTSVNVVLLLLVVAANFGDQIFFASF